MLRIGSWCLRLVLAFFVSKIMNAELHAVGQGRVVYEGYFASKAFATNRFIRIYLPPSYETDPKRRFPVVYLHDGQNVFSTVGPHVAFGWGNWGLDKTVDRLSQTRQIEEVILVGIDCSRRRFQEYRGPAKDPAEESEYRTYAKFLITELKPFIDREYRTLTEAGSTAVMGSSMGGICSLALGWEHPQIFGKVASLSGAFQVDRRYFLRHVLGNYPGPKKKLQIYLDSGVRDYSGGDDGCLDTGAVAAELRRIGWKEGTDLMHRVDRSFFSPEQVKEGGLSPQKGEELKTNQHNEFYWKHRSGEVLQFLFPPQRTNP
jgi:predicted alpha/beta superfamily hydrolase